MHQEASEQLEALEQSWELLALLVALAAWLGLQSSSLAVSVVLLAMQELSWTVQEAAAIRRVSARASWHSANLAAASAMDLRQSRPAAT